MAPHRRGEPPEQHFRSDRVVMARGRWYVVTRERMDIGPFETREEAEAASQQLSVAIDGVDDPKVALALIQEFIRRRGVLNVPRE